MGRALESEAMGLAGGWDVGSKQHQDAPAFWSEQIGAGEMPSTATENWSMTGFWKAGE